MYGSMPWPAQSMTPGMQSDRMRWRAAGGAVRGVARRHRAAGRGAGAARSGRAPHRRLCPGSGR